MKKTLVQVFAVAVALAVVGVAASLASQASADAPDAALREIAGYKGWTRVTEKPVPGERIFTGG